ncbi:MAG TPA: F0F1 ATP synthase subunit epsilon [Streptosporangiaceae bacterium]
MTLQVALVVPEGEIWSGPAQRVIAKTLDGDLGVLAGHTPVLGILSEGSVVRILGEEGGPTGGELTAAVAGGFLSVADDRVSILARDAQLGADVDKSAVRADLDAELQSADHGPSAEESSTARYLRALLRAAGDEA